jgi:catechol 2,3-dioxygenase-like lactoylglutathione lyase family enzyme
VVDDLDASLDFYRNLLGFEIIRRMEETGDFIDTILALDAVRVTTVKMAAPGGQLIELLKFHSHSDPPRPGRRGRIRVFDAGPTHIALTVVDLDRVHHRLTAHGVSFNAPPRLSPDGSVKVTFCRAPEGTLVELVEELQ